MNDTTGRHLAGDLSLAEHPIARFIGLIGRREIPNGFALGLTPCDWVHTFLMRFPLDVVCCDADGIVLRVLADIRPNRLAPRVLGAYCIYEMRAGFLAPYVSVGDRLQIVHLSLSDMVSASPKQTGI
jgi:uncharacterized membrane protein (UPF0127 family)